MCCANRSRMEGSGHRNGAQGHCWMWHRAKGQREQSVPRAKEVESDCLLPDLGWTVPVLALGYVPSEFFSLQRWHCGGEDARCCCTQPCFLHLSGSPSCHLEPVVVGFPSCSSPGLLFFHLACCDSVSGHRVHTVFGLQEVQKHRRNRNYFVLTQQSDLSQYLF